METVSGTEGWSTYTCWNLHIPGIIKLLRPAELLPLLLLGAAVSSSDISNGS